MTPINATVLADSAMRIAPGKGTHRLITVQFRIWKPILAEFNKHRSISNSAFSSRAVPLKRSIKKIREDDFHQADIRCKSSGMQGPPTDLVTKEVFRDFSAALRERSILDAEMLDAEGVHKQHLNRFLEPWMIADVVATGEWWAWDHFFHQRIGDGADPEMQRTAMAIFDAISASKPKLLDALGWHLPYADDLDGLLLSGGDVASDQNRVWISAARCARVSYSNHGTGMRDPLDDLRLADEKLLPPPPEPQHAVPFEHQRQYARTRWKTAREVYGIGIPRCSAKMEVWDGVEG